MKCASEPSAYRNCILRVSVRIGRNFSPARKVLSITAPSFARLSLVRTKAPPFPGLTCWNSTILKTVPSTSMWVPLRNWLVEITSAEGSGAGRHSVDDRQLLRERAQHIAARFGNDDQVLDPDAELAREVDPRLDRDRVAGLELAFRARGEPRVLMDVQAHPVAEPVAEVLAVPRRLDHLARDGVDGTQAGPRMHSVHGGELRLQHERVDRLRIIAHLAGRDRPGAVRAVAIEPCSKVDHD